MATLPECVSVTSPASSDRTSIPGMAEAIGGWRGAIESALPTIVFVAVAAFNRDAIRTAAIIAVSTAVVMAVVRVSRGQTLRYVAAGVFGVALAAFIAARTGRAENFFLPGLILNVVSGAVFVTSNLVRRPLAGYFAAGLTGQNPFGGWHRDPACRVPAMRATWVLAALFLSRLAVQVPLYLNDALVALGTAKLAMGVPLTAVALWLSWLLMRESPLLSSSRATASDS